MRVIFCGTAAFGIPALSALLASDFSIPLIVTQPDRPAGRKRELQPSPVKVAALAAGIEVFQPERLNAPESRERLAALAPDVMVVVAYGQILRRATLDIPRLGCVNIHGSLLPRHRGASPVQAAILAGDAVSGVTVMLMDEGLDTGPMLLAGEDAIRPDDTAPTLHDRLSELGGRLIVPALRGLAARTITPLPQDSARATVCRVIEKDAGHIDWHRPAAEIERAVRAFTHWPGTTGRLQRQDGTSIDLQIIRAHALSGIPSGDPGTIVAATGESLEVAAGEGRLEILQVKPAGRSAMDAGAFLRGYRVQTGDAFVPVT